MDHEIINHEEEENNKKRTIILLIIYIISLILFILSGAFTISTIINLNDVNHHEIQAGQVKMELIDNPDTNIRLINAYPMKYSEAMTLKPFEFKVTNVGTLPVVYRLKLKDINDSKIVNQLVPSNQGRLSNNKINYSLINNKTNKVIATGLISDLKSGILLTEKLLPRYSKSFDFRLWINEHAGNESQNKHYVGEIILEIDKTLKEGVK